MIRPIRYPLRLQPTAADNWMLKANEATSYLSHCSCIHPIGETITARALFYGIATNTTSLVVLTVAQGHFERSLFRFSW